MVFAILYCAYAFRLSGVHHKIGTNILPYTQNQVKLIQQSGDKLHDSRCVIFIDGPLGHHEYTKSRRVTR